MDIEAVTDQLIAGISIDRGQAARLASSETDIFDLMYAANRIRRHFQGNRVEFCSIINARSGRCPNDCKFCAQSSHWHAAVETYPLMSVEQLAHRAATIAPAAVDNVGIVTSGVAVRNNDELDTICRAIGGIQRRLPFKVCASLGELTSERAHRLKQAGLTRYHHNLETSERFYPRLCSSYDYRKKLQTISAAAEAGLQLCCGGIFGAGEDWADRIELAFTLRRLDPDSVPINFLRPVPGTPLEKLKPLPPLEALRIIALFRFILPDKTIKVCGGREHVLGDMQSWMFYAGANGAILGNYLTTVGRRPAEDLAMVKNLGLEYAQNTAGRSPAKVRGS